MDKAFFIKKKKNLGMSSGTVIITGLKSKPKIYIQICQEINFTTVNT